MTATARTMTAAQQCETHKTDIAELLRKIEAAAKETSEPSGDRSIHWGHVGDLLRAKEMLAEAARILGVV